MRRALVLVAALLGALVMAAGAQASSLVYIKDGNVWLANPDGSGQYQVTLDGTPDAPYYSPSQADNGTIVVARGRDLYRMSQNSALLNAPFEPYSPGRNILDPRVSPDGTTIAYGYSTINSAGSIRIENFVNFTFADAPATPPGYTILTRSVDPSWSSNSQVLLSTPSTIEQFFNAGDSQQSDWWSDCDVFTDDCSNSGSIHYPHHMQISRAGDRLAMVRDTGDGSDANTVLDILDANGGPTTHPTPTCELTSPTPGSVGNTFVTPSWSPDGQALAWQEGDGIHVGGNLGDCQNMTGLDTPVIPDGSEPFWGPADINPGPRPAPNTNNGGGGTNNGGGTTNGGGGTTGGSGTTASKTRCVVPKLKGKTLAKAKTALKKAHCKLGKVKKPRHVKKHAKLVVASQTVRAKSRHKAGTKVGVKLAVHR